MRLVKQSNLDAVYLFVAPPSIEVLRARLTGRGTEKPESIQKRLAAAVEEIAYAKTRAHDYVVINGDLDKAYVTFEAIALGEKDAKGDPLPGYVFETGQKEVNGHANGAIHSHLKPLASSASKTPIWQWFASWRV